MRVKLKSAVLTTGCGIEPAGKTLEVSDEVGNNWIARGLADKVQAPPEPPPQSKPQPKGKR